MVLPDLRPSNKLFRTETPILHPKSYEYRSFWREQVNKCISGAWVAGNYMPAALYYYTNFHHIFLNKSKVSSQKVFSLPVLRDIEWELFRNYLEIRGFSGWEDDEEYSCLLKLKDCNVEDLPTLALDHPEIWSDKNCAYKQFMPARELIRMQHPYDKGIPLYRNPAQNMLFMSGRAVGKSYFLSGIALHEWLFDGKPPINRYMTPDDIVGYQKTKTSVILGAGEAAKARETSKKIFDAYNRLPGEYESNEIYYPSPLSIKYAGNFEKEIVAKYKKKVGSNWVVGGSFSKMRTISFADSPFVAQGDRNNLIIFEEIGHFKNPIQVFHAIDANMKFDTTKKFGSLVMAGTGGDMDRGSTLDAQHMFYNPRAFDLLTFKDEWEHKGEIAYFLPTWYGLNHWRNEEGIINEEKARAELDLALEKAKKNKDRASYEKELTYKARTPSEVFLVTEGAIFPITELKARLLELESSPVAHLMEKKIELNFDAKAYNGVDFKLITNEKATPINQFPWPDGKSQEGCIVAYELPIYEERNGKQYVPEDLYIIGHDPFRTDAETGSLAATIVMKSRKYASKYGHDEIVATYFGRPFEGREASNEILFKLALFYNAKVLFENNVGNVKDYFEKKKRLDLLYKRPTTILSNKELTTMQQLEYGYPLSNEKIKLEALQYSKTWLLDERGRESQKKQVTVFDKYGKKRTIDITESITTEEHQEFSVKRNLDKIPCKRTLQELIAYNLKGNFDAVHGLIGCILQLEEDYNKGKAYLTNDYKEKELSFLINNNKLFKYNHRQWQLKNNITT